MIAPSPQEQKAAIEELWHAPQYTPLPMRMAGIGSTPSNLNEFCAFLQKGGGTVRDGINITVPHSKIMRFRLEPFNGQVRCDIDGECPKIEITKIIKVRVDLQGVTWRPGKLKLHLSGVPSAFEPELEI